MKVTSPSATSSPTSRAPTPSAAAEIVVAQKQQISSRIVRLDQRLRSALRDGLQRRRALVTPTRDQTGPGRVADPRGVAGSPGRRTGAPSHPSRRATGLGRRQRQVHQWRLRLEALDIGRQSRSHPDAARKGPRRLEPAPSGSDIAGRTPDSGWWQGRLDTLSPLAVLARGYAVCWDEAEQRIIRDASLVSPGDRVHVALERGALDCEVKKAE